MNEKLMTDVFNLWLQRFQKSPEEFDQITSADGDYGSRCAEYFNYIAKELTK